MIMRTAGRGAAVELQERAGMKASAAFKNYTVSARPLLEEDKHYASRRIECV